MIPVLRFASEITLECPNMVLKLEDVYESVGLG
jgi:hypothetical protein